MTVHIHRINKGISMGDHTHEPPADLADSARTWEVSCSKECEIRLLADVEHTARTAQAVPQTPEEVVGEEVAARNAALNWGGMVKALQDLAQERAGASA